MIELDVQLTKDGHLVVNHEPCLKATTDVEEYEWLFGDRLTSHQFPRYYHNYTDDYFFIDFDLAEVKMLKRKMRQHTRNQAVNYDYKVLTVREAIENLLMLNKNFPRDKEYPTGLYIETKDYNFYLDNYGVDVVEKLHELLAEYGLTSVATSENKLPIIIQSFEKEALQKSMTLSDFPKVNLLSYYAETWDLDFIATFAEAVGPCWNHLLGPNREVVMPSAFAVDAKKAGLDLHAYIVQDDHLRIQNNVIDEYRTYADWGVSFLFSEFPHMAVTVFDYFQKPQLREISNE